GADVVVTYLHDRDGALRTREEVEARGGRAMLFHLDQRAPSCVAALFAATREALGTPTILVNNAGIDESGPHVADLSPEDWDNVLRTNLYGPFYCCQHFIRGLAGSERHGCIINITSVHEEIPRAGAA